MPGRAREAKAAQLPAREAAFLAKYGAKPNNPNSASDKDIQLMSGWDYSFTTRHGILTSQGYGSRYADYAVKSENPNEQGYSAKDGAPLPNLWVKVTTLDGAPCMVGITYNSETSSYDVYIDDDAALGIEDKGVFEKYYRVKVLSPEKIEVNYLNSEFEDICILTKNDEGLAQDGKLAGFFQVETSTNPIWLARDITDTIYKLHNAAQTGVRE